MIDWFEPIRLKKSKRQLFVVNRKDTLRMLGTDPRWGSGGIWYHADGQPMQECPWGQVENYDATEALGMDAWREVANPRERKQQRQLVNALEDNPLFGAW